MATTDNTNVNTQYGYTKISWLAVPNGNQGIGAIVGKFPWWVLQITGTFGASGSIQLEASNDGGTTWVKVGSAITAAGIVSGNTPIGELARVNVTAGDGTTSLNAYLILMGVRG